jgi:hypothetical protein
MVGASGRKCHAKDLTMFNQSKNPVFDSQGDLKSTGELEIGH